MEVLSSFDTKCTFTKVVILSTDMFIFRMGYMYLEWSFPTAKHLELEVCRKVSTVLVLVIVFHRFLGVGVM